MWDNNELTLNGVIASESWFEDDVTPAMFREELMKHTGDITVRINSPGGDVFAGVAIYNMLTEYNGKVVVKVDGLAASIASVIAMAGDEIQMLPGTSMMIHRAWSIAMGDDKEMQKVAAMLAQISENIANIYTERTGLPLEKVNELMDAETWMNPADAVELGFADMEVKPKSKTVVETALDKLKSEVQNAVRMPVLAMARKMSTEQEPKAEEVTDDAPQESSEETPEAKPVVDEVTETTEVDEPAPVEQDEAEVVPEVKPQTEEVGDVAPATEETNEATENKEKEMNEQDVKNQVVAPATEAPKASMSVHDYVKSKASMQDFADVLMANAGAEASEVKAAWESHLSAKMGITNPEVLLPQGVIDAVEDAFKEGGEIWNRVAKTGLDVITAVLDTVTGEDSRAKGHKRGTDKQEEVITLADRKIRAQFIYKYLTLNKEDLRENRSSGALLRYVLSELPQRIIREVERAIVIGDGRAAGSDLKVTSFVSLKADAADNATPYAEEYTPVVGDDQYATIVKATAKVKAAGAKVLIAKSAFVTGLALLKVNGTYMFTPGANLAAALGFEAIITPDWFNDTSDAANDAYVVTLGNYKTVGDTSIESYTNFALKANKNEFLQELYAGGALAAIASAVAIKKAA